MVVIALASVGAADDVLVARWGVGRVLGARRAAASTAWSRGQLVR